MLGANHLLAEDVREDIEPRISNLRGDVEPRIFDLREVINVMTYRELIGKCACVTICTSLAGQQSGSRLSSNELLRDLCDHDKRS